MPYARILGTGSYLPDTILTNTELAKRVETTDEWIIERTGIRERRIIGEDETVATMSTQAALKAIEAAGIDKNSLDMIVLATTSASRALPSAACEVQRELEAHAARDASGDASGSRLGAERMALWRGVLAQAAP